MHIDGHICQAARGALAAATALVALAAPAFAAPSYGTLTQPSGTSGCISEDGLDPADDLGGTCASANLASDVSFAVIELDPVPGTDRVLALTETHIVTLQRAGDGSLTPVRTDPLTDSGRTFGTLYPKSFTVSPDGKDVYVTGNNGLAWWRRDSTTGALTAGGRIVAGAELRDIVVSADGRRLLGVSDRFFYGSTGNTIDLGGIYTYVRDTTTGALTSDGDTASCINVAGSNCSRGPVSLSGASSITLSGDGFAYVAGHGAAMGTGGGLTALRVDTESGRPTVVAGMDGCWTHWAVNGCSNGIALGSASDVVVSPDRQAIYVAAPTSAAIARFSRDTTDGTISQPQGTGGCVAEDGYDHADYPPGAYQDLLEYQAPCGEAQRLDPRVVAMPPDGTSLYAAGAGTVTAMHVNPSSGTLTPLEGRPGACVSEVREDDDAGVELCTNGRGLAGGWGKKKLLALGNRELYLASHGSRAVSMLERSTTGAVAAYDVAPTPVRMETETVFDAGRSFEPHAGATITRYRWDGDGDGTFELDGGSSPRMPLFFDGPGVATIGLQTTSSTGATTEMQRSFEVRKRLPVPALTASRTAPAVEETVEFDASGSRAPDGTITKYEWDFNGNGNFERATGATPTASYAYRQPGRFQATLRVTSDTDETVTRAVTIDVAAPTTSVTGAFGVLRQAPGVTGCTARDGADPLDEDGGPCVAAPSLGPSGADDVAFAPNGDAYAATRESSPVLDRVVRMSRDGDGALTPGAAAELPPVPGDPWAITVSADGADVYVLVNSGWSPDRDATLVRFRRDTTTGALTLADSTEVPFAADFAIAPDGRNLYVVTRWSTGTWPDSVTHSQLRVLSRNTASGALSLLPDSEGCFDGAPPAGSSCRNARGLIGAHGVEVSDDGSVLAVRTDESIALFGVSATTGLPAQPAGEDGCLAKTALPPDEQPTTDTCRVYRGVDWLSSHALSPDGRSLYASSSGVIAVFRRDSATGAVAQLDGVEGCVSADGSGGTCRAVDVPLPNFGGASLAVSRDGYQLYAAGQSTNPLWARSSGTISTLQRSPTTGALSNSLPHSEACIQQAPQAMSCADVRALAAPHRLALSPDGEWVAAVDSVAYGGRVANLRRTTTGSVAGFSTTPTAPATGEELTLDATGSYDPHPGASISEYSWDLDGDGSYERSTGTNTQVRTSFARPGRRRLALQVTSSTGVTTVERWVRVQNRGPTAAVAVDPVQPTAGAPATIDATGSADPDGTIERYQWDLDGNGSFEVDGGKTATVAHSFSAAGVQGVGVRVTDDSGATAEAEAFVDVIEPNPPTATLSVDNASTETGVEVTFDASGSRPGANPIANYVWDFDGNGTTDASGATLSVARHTYNATGDYEAVLRVVDTAGREARVTRLVTVATQSPRIQTIRIEPDAPRVNRDVLFTPVVSGGRVTSVRWDIDDDGQFQLDRGTSLDPVARTYDRPGDYTVAIQVSRRGEPDRIVREGFTVLPDDAAPVARLQVSRDDIETGQAVEFDGSSSEGGASPLVSWQWDLDGDGRYETIRNAPGSVTHTYLAPGTYNAQLRVVTSDDRDATAMRTITVRPRQARTARIAASTTTPRVGQDVELGAVIAGGTVTGVAWDVDGNGSFERAAAPDERITTSFASAGARSVALLVRRRGEPEQRTSLELEVLAAADPEDRDAGRPPGKIEGDFVSLTTRSPAGAPRACAAAATCELTSFAYVQRRTFRQDGVLREPAQVSAGFGVAAFLGDYWQGNQPASLSVAQRRRLLRADGVISSKPRRRAWGSATRAANVRIPRRIGGQFGSTRRSLPRGRFELSIPLDRRKRRAMQTIRRILPKARIVASVKVTVHTRRGKRETLVRKLRLR